MTTSLGPRWAVTGPYMSNALGGGPGGFKHLLTTIGMASKAWVDDMRAHEFDHSAESIERLDSSVQDMLTKHKLKEVEKERDELLVELINMKKAAKSLV